MTRNYTCIICPTGCEISAEIQDNEIISIEGAVCKRGKEYVKLELTDPRRNIASSVFVLQGELPLASVRLTNPIPLDMIFKVIEEIKKVKLQAPVTTGQVIIGNVLNLNSDVIATKTVKKIDNLK